MPARGVRERFVSIRTADQDVSDVDVLYLSVAHVDVLSERQCAYEYRVSLGPRRTDDLERPDLPLCQSDHGKYPRQNPTPDCHAHGASQ